MNALNTLLFPLIYFLGDLFPGGITRSEGSNNSVLLVTYCEITFQKEWGNLHRPKQYISIPAFQHGYLSS